MLDSDYRCGQYNLNFLHYILVRYTITLGPGRFHGIFKCLSQLYFPLSNLLPSFDPMYLLSRSKRPSQQGFGQGLCSGIVLQISHLYISQQLLPDVILVQDSQVHLGRSSSGAKQHISVFLPR